MADIQIQEIECYGGNIIVTENEFEFYLYMVVQIGKVILGVKGTRTQKREVGGCVVAVELYCWGETVNTKVIDKSTRDTRENRADLALSRVTLAEKACSWAG